MDKLKQATPELTDTERSLFFGDRSQDECEQIAEMFERADNIQRGELYRIMCGWVHEMTVNQN